MAVMTIDSDSLTDIADSIREKLGVETTYLPSEMAAAIDSITGGGGGGDAEYILVEWIRSDGTQAIDTGERTTAETEIYADASATNESGKYLWLFGLYPNETSGENEYIGLAYSDGRSIVVFKMNMFIVTGSQTGVRAITSITPTTRSFQPLNGSASSSSTGTMVASNDPMPVFGIGRYEDGEYVVKQLIKATLYKFSINGKDFYPCKRISDGAYGLYNTTDKTFHGDVMDGNPFTAGEEVVPIGGGYGGAVYDATQVNSYVIGNFTPSSDTSATRSGGFSFSSTKTIRVSKVRVYASVTAVNVYMYKGNEEVASVLGATVTANQWSEVSFDSPLVLDSGETYMLFYSHSDGSTCKAYRSSTTSQIAYVTKTNMWGPTSDAAPTNVQPDTTCAIDMYVDAYLTARKAVLVPKTITQNGTYDPADDGADGYSEVTVNVAGGE